MYFYGEISLHYYLRGVNGRGFPYSWLSEWIQAFERLEKIALLLRFATRLCNIADARPWQFLGKDLAE